MPRSFALPTSAAITKDRKGRSFSSSSRSTRHPTSECYSPSRLVLHWREPQPVIQPAVRRLAGFARERVLGAVVDQADAALGIQQAVDGQGGVDEGPAIVAVGAVAADDEDGPRGDEREELVVLHR